MTKTIFSSFLKHQPIAKTYLFTRLVNGFSTLVATQCDAIEQMPKSSQRLIYSPNILLEGEEALSREIQLHKPTVLLIGANKVNEDVLIKWREIFPQKAADKKYKQKLSIIRRGTSIAAIDTKAAAKLEIEVANTPNVNSVEVAKSTYAILQNLRNSTSNNGKNLGLIGFGHVGRSLANQALVDNKSVIAYSPMLYATYREGKKNFNDFDISNIEIAGSIEDVVRNSSEIIISVTIGQYGDGKIIGSDVLSELQPQTKIICISEPEVFSSKGLEELAKASREKDVRVFFDNSPYMIKKLEKEIVEKNGKMENFTFNSAVMSSKECQRDMDIAATALLLQNVFIKKLPDIYRELKECEFWINDDEKKDIKKVRIVGSGISSMIASLYFGESGYEVEILEKDAIDKTNGTTRRGPDVRHLSYTETVTHATTKRIEDWLFTKIINGSFFENLFVEQFKVIGNNKPLVALLQLVVARINKVAIKGEHGWQYLMEKYPDIFAQNVFGSGKILRIFTSQEDLEKAFKFQNSVHDDEDKMAMVSAEELAQKMPMMKHLIDSGKIAGAIEVVGYGVRVISLCSAIEKFLYEQNGVKIKWGQEVKKSGEEFFVQDKFGNVKNLEKEIPLVISSGVTPVIEADQDINRVYGLFISLPNCGLSDAVKIHEKDPLGVMNITPSRDGEVIHISAGFQYFGCKEASMEDLKLLFEKLEERISELFPESYKKAILENSLERRFCPRPMTSHGLPKFTKFDGGVSIGGTNSGGTVEATILGQLALMQVQYDNGAFSTNSEINELVGDCLEVAHNCISYISGAVQMNNNDHHPATIVSKANSFSLMNRDFPQNLRPS